jgi:hypothetical protein
VLSEDVDVLVFPQQNILGVDVSYLGACLLEVLAGPRQSVQNIVECLQRVIVRRDCPLEDVAL